MKCWTGNTGSNTREYYYGISNIGESSLPSTVEQVEAFNSVLEQARELASIFHSHPSMGPVLQLIYVDDQSPSKRVVAYRFTSDWAYRTYYWTLMNAGGSSLARGVWDPFCGDGSTCFDTWLREA